MRLIRFALGMLVGVVVTFIASVLLPTKDDRCEEWCRCCRTDKE